MIPQCNIDYANRIFNERIGQGYVYGGSWSPNIYDGTDCSGCVGMILSALTRGTMIWGHPVSTESWPYDYDNNRPAEPGTVGPFGTIAVGSLAEVPSDAVAIVSIHHGGGGAASHTQVNVEVQPGIWRLMEDNGSYGVCDQTCGAIPQNSLYWTDYWYLPRETDVDTIFADVSEFQAPVDDSYPYAIISIRSNDGTYEDHNFQQNYQWCVDAANDGRLAAFIVYYYMRPGETGCDTHMAMVNDAGGPNPKMITMMDVESGGNPNYDMSSVLNDEYTRLAAWLGDERRVIAYANLGDERSMWKFKPEHLEWILAGYGANPYDPSLIKLAHQYTDGQGYGAASGLPDGCPPFGQCDMNSADGLDPVAFAAACGINTQENAVSNPPAIPKPADEATEVSQLWDQELIRWDCLGGHTVVEALAAIGAKLGIDGFTAN